MASDETLADVLSEFARTMITDFPIQAILDRLVGRIVDVMPITSAGVTLISPGSHPRYVAASDDSALRFEALQTELGEGPCLAAYRTGEAVAVPDLKNDIDFPVFASRAVDAGLAAVFTFPLRRGVARDSTIGALDLYRDAPGPLDPAATTAAQTLADVVAAYLLNAQARADLHDSADRYRENSLHDPLTGLANRVLLAQRLEHAVLRSRRSGRTVAVLFADIDRFKQINDTYGHPVGDELLVAVATRLRGLVRPGDTLARLSGDEFVVLCEDLDAAAPVEAIAARVNAAMCQPFVLAHTTIEVSASVGVAFTGGGDLVPERVLRDADAAMYQAKRRGGDPHPVIDLRDRHVTESRMELEADLRGAVARGELRADYQSIVRTSDGMVSGVEALLRWAHPSRGLVEPATLVPLADHAGLIVDVGRWMLERACRDRQSWCRGGAHAGLGVSVNVSTVQLMSPGFPTTVADVLGDTGIDGKFLTLEVAEAVFHRDGERALMVLEELKELGVLVALDDFGTGYSSLDVLRRFPIDVVKIDRVLVGGIEREKASTAIVAAVVGVAHALGMSVVAKGVETADQQRMVAVLGCESAQGFYFARPMTSDGIGTLVQHLGAAVPSGGGGPEAGGPPQRLSGSSALPH